MSTKYPALSTAVNGSVTSSSNTIKSSNIAPENSDNHNNNNHSMEVDHNTLPPHLSEFYPIINARPAVSRHSESSQSRVHSTIQQPSQSPAQSPVQPTAQLLGSNPKTASSSSPHRRNRSSIMSSMGHMIRRASFASISSFGQTTTASSSAASTAFAERHPDLPALITTKEIQESLQTYDELMKAAIQYRRALEAMSAASARFGEVLGQCSQLKGAGESSDGLAAASGLHYMVSNHHQVLSKTIEQSFEEPVKLELQQFQTIYKEREDRFKHDLKEKTLQLKLREALNTKMSRQKSRNLQEYRQSLMELTTQIDDIDRLKYDYFQSAYQLSEHTSADILQYSASVVRAQVEIYEGIARKGWSGGGLDDLIASCPDPFDNFGMPGADDEPVNVNSLTLLHPSSDALRNRLSVSKYQDSVLESDLEDDDMASGMNDTVGEDDHNNSNNNSSSNQIGVPKHQYTSQSISVDPHDTKAPASNGVALGSDSDSDSNPANDTFSLGDKNGQYHSDTHTQTVIPRPSQDSLYNKWKS